MKKCIDWESDELRDVVQQSTKYVATCHMPMLEAVLRTRTADMMKIKQRHANDIEARAKAKMYGWAKRQGKEPPRHLLLTPDPNRKWIHFPFCCCKQENTIKPLKL